MGLSASVGRAVCHLPQSADWRHWRHGAGISGADGYRRMRLTASILQVTRRPIDGSPHVRARAVVEAQPFRRLAEIATDDVRELLKLGLNVWIERVKIVDC